ncbi:MAG: hypothetical protein J6Q64_01640 [Clostridia bacterium]|nr:hypothetical protein [Clostridia bacterium]
MNKQKFQSRNAGRPKARKGTLPRLLKMLFADFKGLLILEIALIATFGLVSTAPAIYVRTIAGYIATGLERVKAGEAGAAVYADMSPQIIKTILIMVGIYILALTCVFTYQRLGAIITQRFLCNMRKRMFDRM